MNTRFGLVAVLVALGMGGLTGSVAGDELRASANQAVFALQGWIARAEDSICGLSDPKKLSNPSEVRYDELSDATPELKKMKDRNIDPASPEGIQLRQAAVDRIRQASDVVRGERGHCSVWKTVRHKDGRSIPDITDFVKAKF